MKNSVNLEWKALKQRLPQRLRDTSKSDYGHVLVIGGDHGMGGAVRMAAEAALRVGAGLVSVATRPEHLTIVSGCRPEIMCHRIQAPEELAALLQRATVLVIGPGLGKSEWSKSLFNVLLQAPQPKIIDADGLNLLAEQDRRSETWILTPHPGEAARLLGQTAAQIQADRVGALTQLQHRYGGVIVLKGAGTLLKDAAAGPFLCPAGNPGMASAGMGDVLSGVIGGLLAQQLSLLDAAQVGVMIHSMAADQAAAANGERGLLACDLMPFIHRLANPANPK
jgi:ADP-dependent NAD(P)H-hydrate dehydratase / NAD(P)H-hydrate epimerase